MASDDKNEKIDSKGVAGDNGLSAATGRPGEGRKRSANAKSNSSTAATGSPVKLAREIKGNLPYTASPGSIKGLLDAIIAGERPEKLTNNYMETVFKLSGGGIRSVPPLLKKMGFLQSDGAPTELYSRFKTESGRGTAALAGLKQAYPEIFRKNEVAHKCTEDQIRDIIVEITGLTKADPIVRHIINSFFAIRSYIPENVPDTKLNLDSGDTKVEAFTAAPAGREAPSLGLSYHINVVLPESQDQLVYDAIFRSLKRNLL